LITLPFSTSNSLFSYSMTLTLFLLMLMSFFYVNIRMHLHVTTLVCFVVNSSVKKLEFVCFYFLNIFLNFNIYYRAIKKTSHEEAFFMFKLGNHLKYVPKRNDDYHYATFLISLDQNVLSSNRLLL